MSEKVYITYNQIHKLCQESAERILNDFKPNLIIAIGGGGYVPARILRSFLKRPSSTNIPIQAIGLSLYESLPTSAHPQASSNFTKSKTNGDTTTSEATEPASNDPDIETPGTKVTRTQWLDLSSLSMNSLIGKNILIVDEVDDTRTTLEYAVKELEKDVETARKKLAATQDSREADQKTTFSIFVLHNKAKEKRGKLPEDMFEEGRYMAARETGDVWICYPWEAGDIDEHDRLAKTHGRSAWEVGDI